MKEEGGEEEGGEAGGSGVREKVRNLLDGRQHSE